MFVFFGCLKRRKRETVIIGTFGFGFLSNNGRFVTVNCFSEIGLLKPHLFIVFVGCALFGPSCQKGTFWTPKI